MRALMSGGGGTRPGVRTHFRGFTVCAALFVGGCLLGTAAAVALPAGTPVGTYISGLSVAGAEIIGQPAGGLGERFLSALLSAGKYHIIALLFAFSLLGVAGIPAVAALRGFLLCFTMSAAVRYYGAPGIPAALAIFAPEALIAVPCLFVISAQSFTASFSLLSSVARRAGKAPSPYGGGFFGRCALCAAALAASALVTAAVLPGALSRLV